MNRTKVKGIVGMLGLVLLCQAFPVWKDAAPMAQTVFASVEGQVLPEDLEPDYQDPDYVKRQELKRVQEQDLSLRAIAGTSTKSPYTGREYIHGEQQQECEITHGVDVSKWQADIDWDKVKADGISFVFIRCGYTSLQKKFKMNEDEYFRKNVRGAYEAGLKVGVYYFSNSKTEAEAEAEAEKTIELISDYKEMITLPVVYDFEAFNDTYRAFSIVSSDTQVTDNMLKYMSVIEAAGFTPIYYTGPAMVNTCVDLSRLTAYDCWVANYTTKTIYTGPYIIWQYASDGKVDGINGNADCNFWYKKVKTQPVVDADTDGPERVTGLVMYANSDKAVRISWDASEDADGYQIYRSKYYSGGYRLVETIENPDTLSFRDGDFENAEGRQLYYKIVPYREEDGEILYGEESRVLTAYLLQKHTYKLKTQLGMNIREQAGTEYDTVAVVPEGTYLRYPKYTYSKDGKVWYKVSYKKKGKTYVGYISSKYVSTYAYGQAKLDMGIREAADMSSKRVLKLKKKHQVTITGYAKDSLGRKWAKVAYKADGTVYRGYCLFNNLRQI